MWGLKKVCVDVYDISTSHSNFKKIGADNLRSAGTKHFSTMAAISLGRCAVEGKAPPATLNIMVCGLNLSQTGLSPKSSTIMHAVAYISVPTPTNSPLSCSGGWKAGVPAVMVVRPAQLFSATLPRPKSATNT